MFIDKRCKRVDVNGVRCNVVFTPTGGNERYCNNHKLSGAEQRRIDRVNNRLKVLQHYSNDRMTVCACPGCGEARLEFLTIDHINVSVNKHRQEIGDNGSSLMHWLIVNDYPDGYRVLCMNCNHSYGRGYCPHQYEAQ